MRARNKYKAVFGHGLKYRTLGTVTVSAMGTFEGVCVVRALQTATTGSFVPSY